MISLFSSPYISYIATAYAITIAVLAVMALWYLHDFRTQKRLWHDDARHLPNSDHHAARS